jgi:alpha-tubulin suppressor-like RCC1 family protein
VKIESGIEYNLALTNNGELYGWGNNDAGQLGNSNTNYSE